MKLPNLSWRPTTAHLTTAALAVVCLLVGFWVGWAHRSNIDPTTVTPSVPKNMRARAVGVTAPTTATSSATAGTTPSAATGTTPAAVLPLRAETKIAVLNAGPTPGIAVQLAVSIVDRGYPTPAVGNVLLPPSQPSTSTAPATPTTTTTAGTTTSTTSTAPTPATPQLVIYYRPGEQAVAGRLGTDLGITVIAPIPVTGPVPSAAPSAQLIVVVGGG
jgi:hypothetical protein